MRRFTRRRFLGSALAAGAALGGGLARRARAGGDVWGSWPETGVGAPLDPSRRARNVLEVFLLGGLSPWETFYVVDRPEYGQADKRMWWTFQEGEDSVAAWHARCLGDGAPPLLQPFATDALGVQVNLGPFADPFRQRQDIVDRLRIQVMSHGLFPHEAAQALAMTGARLGQPRLAGIGAPISRHFGAQGPGVGLPRAYVIGEHFTEFASTYGQHPASCRPLRLRAARLDSFARGLRNIAENDAWLRKGPLLDHYLGAYQRRLSIPSTRERVRAPAFEDLAFVVGLREGVDLFADTLEGASVGTGPASVCGWDVALDIGRAQLELATWLLALPDDATRHVTVIDRAYEVDVATGYDTHQRHVEEAAQRYPYFWQRLIERINAPGEADPNKIDLDETLVVINTEFGRSPEVQVPDGRNHYPQAYVTLMFGGPVGPEQRGIVGAIDPAGVATGALRPAATRAATLAALGIYPFASDAYSVGDLADVDSEADGVHKLHEVVLGIPS